MKRILIALAILASVQIAGAQVKPEAARKAVEAAEAAAQNAKKNTKAATWQALGKAYVNAYDAPTGNIWVGAGENDLKLVMGGENPMSTEEVVILGQPYVKKVYSNKNLYFRDGILQIIEITKPVVDNSLDKAVEAYQKAYELEPKKAAEIATSLNQITEKMSGEAYNSYSLGNFAKASQIFENVANVAAKAPLSQLDTNSLYNAGFTAQQAGQKDRALGLFKKCYEAGYYSEGGEIFAKLADLDTLNTKKYLEEGFEKYPQSQSIMIGLINYYIKTGESTDNLFALLDKAKQNEPNNASLYYVEGNTRAQLGQEDLAIAAYEKCAQIDPNYAFGYIGEGIYYYNKAIEFQDKAQNEMDDRKYEALVKDFEAALKNCIAPFEKAYGVTKDDEVKVSIAEYLKNAYYRFSSSDDAYKAGYDKYSAVVANGRP